ncbi:hypothetical protein TNCV_1108401 [Trichonephila clavipes]|nr:hypothetical protein TNCV_1108401 [Trichonephila clavipes]
MMSRSCGSNKTAQRVTIDLLKDTFGDRLISRFGPVNWPPRSCDLTPLDYFLWGYKKRDPKMSGVKKKMSGSQKRKIRKEKEYNINSKYAKLDNFLISASSSCASASSSNARELGQAHPGIHTRRIW